MTTLTNYSSLITNSAATPIVRNAPTVDGGNLKVKIATLAVAADDANGSIYGFVELPSNAVVSKIDLLNDAITDGTSYDFGLYTMNAQTKTTVTVANVNAWGNAIDLSSARVAPLDITHEGGSDSPIEYALKKVWELAGASSDPRINYMLCATATTVGTAAGDITLKVYYTV